MSPTEGEPPGQHLPPLADNGTAPPAAAPAPSPARSPPAPEQQLQLGQPPATGPPAPKPIPAGMKRGRSGGNLEDDTSAAELLLGIGTKSEGGSGDSKGGVQGTAAKATAAAAAAAAAKAKNAAAEEEEKNLLGGAAIRRSSRRGPSSGVNPAVVAALAAENSGSDEEVQAVAPARRGGGARGRPSNGSAGGAGGGNDQARETTAVNVEEIGGGVAPSGIKSEANVAPSIDNIMNASSIEAAAANPLPLPPISNADLAAVMNLQPLPPGTFLPPGAPIPGAPNQLTPTGATSAAPLPIDPNAVQKSELTLLCERFQYQFGHLQEDGTPALLMLNDVAEALGVPRRRLYDVINVFEAIEVMRRVGKLMYEFCGYDHLPTLLEQLYSDEINGRPVEDRVRRAPAPATTAAANAQVAAAAAAAAAVVAEGGDEAAAAAAAAAAAVEQGNQDGDQQPPRGQPGRSSSHSLWVLSRRLVRMILRSDVAVSLTGAAAELVGPGGVPDPTQNRTQTQITVERRLYDIGSILCSLGLVERVYLKKRQPAFEWIYGWRPGNTHQPPELAVATMSRQPAPPLALIPRRPEDAGARQGRRGARGGAGGGGGGGKRQKIDQAAAAAAAANAAAAAHATYQMNPFAFGGFGMPGMPGFPGMAALPGLDPAALGAAAGGVGVDASGVVDKNTQLAISQYMSSPAFLMSMGMGMMPTGDMSGLGAPGGAMPMGLMPGPNGTVGAVPGANVIGGNGAFSPLPGMPNMDMAAMAAAAFAADPQQQQQLQLQQQQQMPKVDGDGQQQQQQQQLGGVGGIPNTGAMDAAAMAAFADPMSAAMMSMWAAQPMINPAMMQFQQQAAAAAYAGQQQQQQQQQGAGGMNGAMPATTALQGGADAQGNGAVGGGTEEENAAMAAAATAAAAAQFQMYGNMILPGMMPGTGMVPVAGIDQQKQQQQPQEGGAADGGKDAGAPVKTE
jgi:hypothetical protein